MLSSRSCRSVFAWDYFHRWISPHLLLNREMVRGDNSIHIPIMSHNAKSPNDIKLVSGKMCYTVNTKVQQWCLWLVELAVSMGMLTRPVHSLWVSRMWRGMRSGAEEKEQKLPFTEKTHGVTVRVQILLHVLCSWISTRANMVACWKRCLILQK